MLSNFTSGTLSVKTHVILCGWLLLFTNSVSLVLYGLLRFIFFEFPFEPVEELSILLKLFSVAISFALFISLLLIAVDAVEYFIRKRREMHAPVYLKPIAVAVVAPIILLAACNAPATVGIKKDLNTGLSCSYAVMEPASAMLVMNNEVINHTDIPLGESFILVNDGVKGMQVKNGKVVVGCALKISDQHGKLLLEEKDIFAGHDTFDEKDAKMLKCTVNTGQPMKWEEKYNVAVIFWDKNSKGKIENNVTIRCIDIP
jgi:hypothetical protein